MPKVAVYKQNGEKTGEMELKETIFGIEPNEAVVHEAVVMQLASWRQGGTHATKTRARCGGVVDVNPGGKKVLVGPE